MSNDIDIKCPNCKKNIFQSKDNKLKIRTNIIIFEKAEDGDYGGGILCNNCKQYIKIPIKLDSNNEEIKHIILKDK